jgi:hypothetical protein
MKKILITNIGNRNILYKNQIIENTVFRVETERIWQNFDSEKQLITIQIIPNHIDSETEKIILVSTSQENPAYNFQDTLFEGKILKLLLETSYNIPVMIENFEGNPTDENQIFPFYSQLLHKLIHEKKDIQVVFNDAGGTPQMKLAAKELLAYYLLNEQYKIVYSDQNDEKREIQRLFKNKYLLLKIAQNFVNEFNYHAAFKIIEQIDSGAGITDNLKIQVWLASKRINFELKEIELVLQKNNSLNRPQRKLYEPVITKNAPKNSIGFEPFNSHSRLSIFEIASICQLYFHSLNYTLGIATYYRFCEEFFQRYARNASRYDLTRGGERSRFLDENNDELARALNELIPGREFYKTYGLPALMLFAWINGSDEIKKITALFMQTISLFRQNQFEGIDLLRNQCFLAHKNNSVTEEMIQRIEPEFLSRLLPAIFEAVHMPAENIYISINRSLNAEFLNQ